MKLIYISGCHHGGTTLLHRLLGAQPEIINLGSVKNLTQVCADSSGEHCSCGQKFVDCGFWQSVSRRLHAQTGRDIENLDVNSPDDARFKTDNQHFFEAVASETGAKFIVDSSRNAKRLGMLLTAFGADALVPIHLYRRPEAQLYSWIRKKRYPRATLSRIKDYNRIHIRGLQSSQRANSVRVISYERLCSKPTETLESILRSVGLSLAQNLLSSWGENPIHVLGGNRMLGVTDSQIRVDNSWRAELTGWQLPVIRAGCSPIYWYMQHLADN